MMGDGKLTWCSTGLSYGADVDHLMASRWWVVRAIFMFKNLIYYIGIIIWP